MAVNVTWMERECLSNASQHVPICLQPFTTYSEILVGNCNFFLPLAFNAPVGGVPIGMQGKSLVLRKLSWGYQAVKTVWRQVEPFRHNTSVWQTYRRTDRRPAYIAITCFSMADARKNEWSQSVQRSRLGLGWLTARRRAGVRTLWVDRVPSSLFRNSLSIRKGCRAVILY